MRFMHAADIHLGYQQYNSKDRFNDFSKVFFHLTDQAIKERVDFLLLAGDLFEKRIVDPLAMRVAVEGLQELQEARIPVVAVQGNHEKTHYRDQYSWVDFLDALGYLRLLNPGFQQGHAVLEPYAADGGAYVDLASGVRIYGLKYYGASTSKVFQLFADGLKGISDGKADFTILIAHAGLEGQLPHYSGTLAYNDLAPLHEQIDYLALGHIHKPYAVEEWVYNPGSLETCSMDEVQWPERGYYLVDVWPNTNPGYEATLISPPRRPFHRLRLAVDALEEPRALYDAVRALLRREDRKISRSPAPVIELTLSGILAFNRIDLDLNHIQEIVQDALSPLLARIRNMTTPAEFDISVDVESSRPELERSVVRELLERDARYRPAAKEWTHIALDLKRMALEKSTPEAIIDYLRRTRSELVSPGKEA